MADQSIEDLGDLSEAWLIFGGPYGNLQATEALRIKAEVLGIPASRVICNGDTVAYCGQPEETVSTLRQWGARVMMGNCEESLANKKPDCGCGFESGSSCSLLSESWYSYCSKQLSDGSKRWMGTLPVGFQFTLNGLKIRLVHGAVSRINRFVFTSTPAASKLEELSLCDADVVIGGHAGIPFGQTLGDHRYWLNSGVIGMPANDGTRDGWYLLLVPIEHGIRCEWHRLRYAACKAQAAMRDAGQRNGYAEALISGLWPSMDVLPDQERRLQGQAIEPWTMKLTKR